jgi:hypothetical protein
MHANVLCTVCGKTVMMPGANASLCTGLNYSPVSESYAIERYRVSMAPGLYRITPIRVLEQWMRGEEDDTYNQYNQTFGLCRSETIARDVIRYVLNYTRVHFGDDVECIFMPRMPDSGYGKLMWGTHASYTKETGDGYKLLASLTITNEKPHWECEDTPMIEYLLYKNEVAGKEIEYGMFIMPELEKVL